MPRRAEVLFPARRFLFLFVSGPGGATRPRPCPESWVSNPVGSRLDGSRTLDGIPASPVSPTLFRAG